MAKILIVDDRAINLEFLSSLLEVCGHEVSEAVNGSDALNVLSRQTPDLIITDLMMPVMDGLELARCLRADAATVDEVFPRLADSIPWHAERREMYDRTVEVPRLLCMYGVGQELPDPVLAQARDELGHAGADRVQHHLRRGARGLRRLDRRGGLRSLLAPLRRVADLPPLYTAAAALGARRLRYRVSLIQPGQASAKAYRQACVSSYPRSLPDGRCTCAVGRRSSSRTLKAASCMGTTNGFPRRPRPAR